MNCLSTNLITEDGAFWIASIHLQFCIALFRNTFGVFRVFKIDLHLGMDKGLLESQELEGAAVGICNIGKAM